MENGENGAKSGYGLNQVHGGPPGKPNPPANSSTTTFARPSSLIMIGDHGGLNGGGYMMGTGDNSVGFNRLQLNPHRENALRHNDGANYTFADGHVKWYTPNGITCKADDCMWSKQGEH